MLEYTKFIVCPNSECCELYSTTFQLDTSEIHKCTQLHYGLQCNKPLLYEKFLSFGKRRFIPYKMFIYLSPITWLKMFYGNESFKELLPVQLQHATGNDCLEDVWDGRVWKSFKCDNRGIEKWFFSDLYHVALILNIDWFKPFKHSEYKVGGIYMNVLNSPRTERYKTKWTMLIGLIPGPTDNNVRTQANEYFKARNKTEAKRIQKNTAFRWSELLCLPYFDIVKMVTVDPMHTILLGMIRRETELILQDPLFCGESREVFCDRMKSLRVPYDIGRLPNSLTEKLEFSSLTADQRKNFA